MSRNFADARAYFGHGEAADAAAWIGRETTREAPYAVNEAQIGYYAAALEDPNENYWDAAAAGRRYGAIISPPGMFQVWVFPLPWHPAGRPACGPQISVEVPLPGDTIINVSTETDFHAPMRAGDRLVYSDRVENVSPLKRTAVGAGHFITTRTTCRKADGPDLVTNLNVLFRYCATADEAAKPAAPERPAAAADAARLPEVTLPLDVSRLILGVAATRDFFPGHHDPAFARASGVRDMFLNTMFLQGLVDRVGCAWAGPDAWLGRRVFRMLLPACNGDTLRTEGRVVARRVERGRHLAEVEIDVLTGKGLATTARLTFDLDGLPGS